MTVKTLADQEAAARARLDQIREERRLNDEARAAAEDAAELAFAQTIPARIAELKATTERTATELRKHTSADVLDLGKITAAWAADANARAALHNYENAAFSLLQSHGLDTDPASDRSAWRVQRSQEFSEDMSEVTGTETRTRTAPPSHTPESFARWLDELLITRQQNAAAATAREIHQGIATAREQAARPFQK